MRQELKEAFGYSVGQVVRMLVSTTGSDDKDVEHRFEPGALAIISDIENLGGKQRVAFTLAIEGTLTNTFDEGDGLPQVQFFEPIMIEKAHASVPLTVADIKNVATYTDSAFSHGDDSDPDHEVGDLQTLLRVAFGLMTEEQKIDFFLNEEVRDVLTAGGTLRDD